MLQNCVITANSDHGVFVNGLNSFSANSCTISGNTGGSTDGINGSTECTTWKLSNNIFYGNGRYGVNSPGRVLGVNYFNAFGGNGTAAVAGTGMTVGTGAITLSADPFTNSATGDYSLNTTSGGGADLRALGFPGAFPGGTMTGYADVGPIQHQDSGGGGTNSNANILRGSVVA
jgi:hypothetical protein